VSWYIHSVGGLGLSLERLGCASTIKSGGKVEWLVRPEGVIQSKIEWNECVFVDLKKEVVGGLRVL
jgi:hypothetical protein